MQLKWRGIQEFLSLLELRKSHRNILAKTRCVRNNCDPMECSVPTFAEGIAGFGTSAPKQAGMEVPLLTGCHRPSEWSLASRELEDKEDSHSENDEPIFDENLRSRAECGRSGRETPRNRRWWSHGIFRPIRGTGGQRSVAYSLMTTRERYAS